MKSIRRATRKHHSAEEKIRIVLRAPRRVQHRRAVPAGGIAESLYYSWSKEFLEAGRSAWLGIQPAQRPAAR